MASKSAIDILKRILLSFRRNWGLKLISLFFAVILWNYVVVTVDPTKPMTYKVTVTPTGLTQLKNNGLAIKGEIPATDVNVTVQLRRSEAATFNSSRIQVTADFQYVTKEGSVEIVLTHNQNTATTTLSMPKIKVEIEKREKRDVPVTYEYVGSLPSGFWMSEPEFTSTLAVSGASSKVSNVAGAKVRIDISNLTQAKSALLNYELIDSKGDAIADTAGLEYSTSGNFSIQVSPKKTVAIDAEGSLIGEVARGYEKTSLTCSPETIDVYGPQTALDALTTVKTTAINIDGAAGTLSFTVQARLPAGVHAVSGSDTIEVNVTVVEKQAEVSLENLPVSITGLSAGLQVDAKFTASVVVTCPEIGSSDIRPSKIRLFVDAAGLDAGAHTLPILAEYADGVKVYAIAITPQNIAVQIKAVTP